MGQLNSNMCGSDPAAPTAPPKRRPATTETQGKGTAKLDEVLLQGRPTAAVPAPGDGEPTPGAPPAPGGGGEQELRRALSTALLHIEALELRLSRGSRGSEGAVAEPPPLGESGPGECGCIRSFGGGGGG
jgi:hypothetical protein